MPVFAHPASGSQYALLPMLDGEDTPKPEFHSEQRHGAASFIMFMLACLGAICSSVLAAMLFSRQISTTADMTDDLTTLPYLIPYPQLDRARNKSQQTFPPIFNFPEAVLQIGVEDSTRKVQEDYTRAESTDVGEIYPMDRHIVVNEKTSTIVQLRFTDYAMERCSLVASVPKPAYQFDPAAELHPGTEIDVWVLDAPNRPIGFFRGSLEKAPPRRTHLASFILDNEGNATYGEFDCPSGDFMMLELACSPTSTACLVDFWQSKRSKSGIFLMQFSSTSGASALP